MPAGKGGPVSSAVWCGFNLSGDSAKVSVMLGQHNQHFNENTHCFLCCSNSVGTFICIYTEVATLNITIVACTVCTCTMQPAYLHWELMEYRRVLAVLTGIVFFLRCY